MNVIKYCLTFQYHNTAQIAYSVQRRDIAINCTEPSAKWSVIIVNNILNVPMINRIINKGFEVINFYTENMAMINETFLNLFACVLCLN